MGQNNSRSTDQQFARKIRACTPAMAIVSGGDCESRPSPIAVKLFRMLTDEGVRHCHWKSNIRLDETLSGLQDIDLLVHPSDSGAFQRIINACGFKLAVSRIGVGHAGVFHALAWDPDSGRLLDLHAYHQLVSGDSLVKSYRFPIEQEFLARTTTSTGVTVPEPSAELVLYVLRILLKHTSLIEIRKVNSHFTECRSELSWLIGHSDFCEAQMLCDTWFASLRIPLRRLVDCVAAGSLASRTVMGMRVAWALRGQRRIGHVAAACSRLIRFGQKYSDRMRRRRALSPLAGGAWIALAGPKGTGKSTLAKLVAQRLGAKLDVKKIHFGKPPRTWRTVVPGLLVAAARKIVPQAQQPLADTARGPHGHSFPNLFVIGKWLVALDRRQLLIRGMRATAAGTILISDRCHVTNGTGMDGSAFDDAAIARARSGFQRWLMKRERAIYRSMPRPRLVLQLSVPLETALERDRVRSKRGGPDPVAVQRRWSRESGSEFAGSTVRQVKTDGDLENTMREVAAHVWQSI